MHGSNCYAGLRADLRTVGVRGVVRAVGRVALSVCDTNDGKGMRALVTASTTPPLSCVRRLCCRQRT